MRQASWRRLAMYQFTFAAVGFFLRALSTPTTDSLAYLGVLRLGGQVPLLTEQPALLPLDAIRRLDRKEHA